MRRDLKKAIYPVGVKIEDSHTIRNKQRGLARSGGALEERSLKE